MRHTVILLLISLLSGAYGFALCSTRISFSKQIDFTTQMTSADEDVEVVDKNMEVVWRHIKKPLLRIGKSGMTESHGNSLKDLLDQHGAVKVKINTGKLGTLEEVFAELKVLAEKAGAEEGIDLLRIRPSDSTVMIGAAGIRDKIVEGSFPSKESLEKEARRKQFIAEKKAKSREAREKSENKRQR